MFSLKKMISSAYNNMYTTGMAGFRETSTTGANVYENQTLYEHDSLGECINDLDIGKYNSMEIVAWFLAKESMTHLKLQKLCYYAQAWFYTLKGFRLMDADFQAWVHGPVAPEIYEKFKCFGFSSIRLAEKYDSQIEDDDIELLESVWETYGDRTGNALEALSHTEKPWLDARVGYADSERCNVVITPESMIEYYSTIYVGGEA